MLNSLQLGYICFGSKMFCDKNSKFKKNNNFK
jgi:hypothetical protein